jgi:hypothetical protein
VSASPGWIRTVMKPHRDVVTLSCTSTALVVRKRMPSIRHLRTMAYPRVLTFPFVHLAACGANERNSNRREAAQYNPLGFQSRRYRCERVWAQNQYVAHDRLPPGDHFGACGVERAYWLAARCMVTIAAIRGKTPNGVQLFFCACGQLNVIEVDQRAVAIELIGRRKWLGMVAKTLGRKLWTAADCHPKFIQPPKTETLTSRCHSGSSNGIRHSHDKGLRF